MSHDATIVLVVQESCDGGTLASALSNVEEPISQHTVLQLLLQLFKVWCHSIWCIWWASDSEHIACWNLYIAGGNYGEPFGRRGVLHAQLQHDPPWRQERERFHGKCTWRVRLQNVCCCDCCLRFWNKFAKDSALMFAKDSALMSNKLWLSSAAVSEHLQ